MLRIVIAAGVGYVGGKYLRDTYPDLVMGDPPNAARAIAVQGGVGFVAYLILGRIL